MNKFNYLRTRTAQMMIVLAIIVALSLLGEVAPGFSNLIGEIISVIFLLITVLCVLLFIARTQRFPLPTILQISASEPAEKKAHLNTQLLLISTASMVAALFLLWITRM